jgi:hypothetical protein
VTRERRPVAGEDEGEDEREAGEAKRSVGRRQFLAEKEGSRQQDGDDGRAGQADEAQPLGDAPLAHFGDRPRKVGLVVFVIRHERPPKARAGRQLLLPLGPIANPLPQRVSPGDKPVGWL